MRTCASIHLRILEEEVEEFWGDLSGAPLDPGLVKNARSEEMREFRNHEVYEKVSIEA